MGQPLVNMEGVAVNEAFIKKLGARLNGELLRPGDDRYDQARKVWNGMHDRHPGLIVRCADADDVTRALDFGRDHLLLLAVKGAGHSMPGHSVCDDGMVIHLSPMKGISVDRARKTVRVEAGVTWGELDHETQAHRLAVTGGMVTHTGVAGLTLGGGHGWLMRKHGLSCDNLLSVEVVTADGKLVTASHDENQDLFWGLRGGGGNFGIVTSLTFRLHPLGTVLGGLVGYPLSEAKTVMSGFGEAMANAPDELRTTILLFNSPDGHPVIGIAVCYAGDLERGEHVLKPLREFGTVVLDLLGPMPYPQVQTLLDVGAVPGRRYYSRANYLSDFSADLVGVLRDQFLKAPSPLTSVLGFQFGGASSRMSPDATAFSHRDAAYMLELWPVWEDIEEDEQNLAWLSETWEAVQPFLAPGNYVNTLAQGEGEDRVREAYSSTTYERLVALKSKYDPTNLFRLNQNIPPVPSGAAPTVRPLSPQTRGPTGNDDYQVALPREVHEKSTTPLLGVPNEPVDPMRRK